jgi:glycosyltransferase involved in cell wall biosynthesis
VNREDPQQLRIEVLVNSIGPHERVRVRDPFFMLQRMGVDVRLHRYPFHLPSCIRPNSLVIWQRPIPESWERQMEILRWIRDRGCLLLTEWDDHPELFPQRIRVLLKGTNTAALQCCHVIHTSSTELAFQLKAYNEATVVLENATRRIPDINLRKHLDQNSFKVFIGNQNRDSEHNSLAESLSEWCRNDVEVKVVIIEDENLRRKLPADQVEHHKRCRYEKYRSLMRSCHVALLPLQHSIANACKTPIKWIEGAAESTVCIAGPELYGKSIRHGDTGWLVDDIREMTDAARWLKVQNQTRLNIAINAHAEIVRHHSLSTNCSHRLWIYERLWKMRSKIDSALISRLPEARTTNDILI